MPTRTAMIVLLLCAARCTTGPIPLTSQSVRQTIATKVQTGVACPVPQVFGGPGRLPVVGLIPSKKLSGSSFPPYPVAYRANPVSAEITVRCVVKTDGSLCGCDAVRVVGPQAFADAAIAWLTDDQSRYSPYLLNGVAVVGERQWVVTFAGTFGSPR
jgi:hypothetical protein